MIRALPQLAIALVAVLAAASPAPATLPVRWHVATQPPTPTPGCVPTRAVEPCGTSFSGVVTFASPPPDPDLATIDRQRDCVRVPDSAGVVSNRRGGVVLWYEPYPDEAASFAAFHVHRGFGKRACP